MPEGERALTGPKQVQWAGTLLALSSAASFGVIPVLTKLVYRFPVTVSQVQVARFVVITAGLTGIVAATRRGRSLTPSAAKLLALAGFGATVYGPQSFFFFTALQSLPASLVELVFYVYPALVLAGAWVFYRRPASWRSAIAVIGAAVGTGLVLGLAHVSVGAPLILAVATPVMYTAYLLGAERLLRDVGAFVGTAAVTTGATGFWLLVAAVRRDVTPPAPALGWEVPLALVCLTSLWCVPALFAAVLRIGADKVAIISTIEPVVTVVLAAVILTERLSPVQLVGAALILGAIVLIQWPRRGKAAHDLVGAPSVSVGVPP